MTTYDCFTFFNELDLLEIRLSEMNDYVDYFVIVEADKNFAGIPKKFVFPQNKKRFEKWNKKIIYLKCRMPNLNLFDKIAIKIVDSKHLPRFGTDSLGLNFLSSLFGVGRWKYVYKQRERIIDGLKDAKNSDIIIASDLDEIPKKEFIPKAKELLNKYDYILFQHKMFYYFLNGLDKKTIWIGARIMKFKTLKKDLKGKFQFVRNPSFREFIKSKFGFKRRIFIMKEGGWHFTYLGSFEKIKEKTNSVAEGYDIERTDQQLLQDIKKGIFRHTKNNITTLEYIDLDESFPETIRKNKEKYSHLLEHKSLKTKNSKRIYGKNQK